MAATAGCEEALRCVRSEPCEMAILDLRMPGESGMNLLSELREVAPGTQVVILTGFGSIASTVEHVEQGAIACVAKPAVSTKSWPPSPPTSQRYRPSPTKTRLRWHKPNGNISNGPWPTAAAISRKPPAASTSLAALSKENSANEPPNNHRLRCCQSCHLSCQRLCQC